MTEPELNDEDKASTAAKEKQNNEKEKEENKENDEKHRDGGVVDVAHVQPPAHPSMTLALFVYWVLPILLLAIFSRFGVDTSPPIIPVPPGSELKVDISKQRPAKTRSSPKVSPSAPTPRRSPTPSKPTAPPVEAISGPTAYKEVMSEIYFRKRKWRPAKVKASGNLASSSVPAPTPSPPSSSTSTKKSPPTTRRSNSNTPSSRAEDPVRRQLEERIDGNREAYMANPNNVFKGLALADSLRVMDLKYHDGGSRQAEGLEIYQKMIDLTLQKRQAKLEAGEPTNQSLSGTTDVPGEVLFADESQKSIDGLLCGMYTNKGKLYFMANMFELAVESYTKCIDIEPLYLDAVGSRGSSLIILGKYAEAAKDFSVVLEHDTQRLFNDAFTGMAKVLAVKEEVVPGGWATVTDIIDDMLPQLAGSYSAAPNEHVKRMVAETLNRLHHVMFMYHDSKTKDVEMAWAHLTDGYRYKMSVISEYNQAFEKQKLSTTKGVFNKAFFQKDIGSDSKVPIFIIGFVRSGSTLLERVLDAHPAIVGTGEDSVFNGRLDQIRNSIVQASLTGNPLDLRKAVRDRADEVVNEMRSRYENIEANVQRRSEDDRQHVQPERFADKMLTNYFNVGFIHMLFPDALILHVARNPMDTIFSAYKHEFPPGGLDYTSEFASLAHMYESYREVIKHWDDVLPGRVTHVRYEDLVNDMPGMAKSIIRACDLEWYDSVLDFHKKKHAVNTLSTTQVRKGVYKHSIEAWKKYETQLRPLLEMVGPLAKWSLKTSLPGYVAPFVGEE